MTSALGIDVGTTNAKVALVAEDGTLVASAARPLTTTRDGDRIEQDPAHVWASVCDAVREVTAAAFVSNAKLAEVSKIVVLGLGNSRSSSR